MTGRTTRAERMRCRWPATRSGSSPKPAAAASARSSSAAPTSTPARSTSPSSPAAPPRGTCPACAERARSLRAQQCRDGWHLEDEPDPRRPPDETQEDWLLLRAEAQVRRDHARSHRPATRPSWMSSSASSTTSSPPPASAARLPAHRQEAPDYTGQAAVPVHPPPPGRPRPPQAAGHRRTTGRVYTAPDGKTFRPSMFLTLTCDTYGKVGPDGTPGRPRPLRLPAGRPGRAPLRRRCSTGSSRTCAATSATTSSTSPPSNPRNGSPRTPTSPSAAPSPAPTCAPSSPPPTTRSGGHPPTWSGTTTSCRSGTSHRPLPRPATGESCRPGTRPSTPSARTMSRCTSPGSGRSSTPRASSPEPKTLPVHRLPHQIPDQAARRLPHRRTDAQPTTPPGSPRRSGTSPAHRPARTGSATASSPRTPAPGLRPRPVQRQSPPPREPRLRRTPRPGLPQMVRQNPRRPPRRPQSLAHGHARTSGSRRPSRYTLGTRHPRRPRPHAPRPAAAARPHRPRPMASRPRRSQTQSR